MKNNHNTNTTIHPWFVTGLVDGEGSFNFSIIENSEGLLGFKVKFEFKVTQKSHSEKLLWNLKDFFGCGSVVIDNRKTDTKKFHVTNTELIYNKILPHFDNYPCVTSKFLNFQDWKKALLLSINNKNTPLNKQELLEIKSKMNSARSLEEKYEYCKSALGMYINAGGQVDVMYNLTPEWVQAFIAGEGTFYTFWSIKKSRGKEYQGCDSSLEIGQNNHDVAILLAIKKFFKGGYIKPKYNYSNLQECKNSRSVNRYVFRNTKTIIEFIDNYPMLNDKQQDYNIWKEIVNIKNSGLHKTEVGKNKIVQLLNVKK